MYALILALSVQTNICTTHTTAVSATSPKVFYQACNGDFVPGHYGDCNPIPVLDQFQVCVPQWETHYTRLTTYPTYKACMEKVASIGESDTVWAVCRRVK